MPIFQNEIFICTYKFWVFYHMKHFSRKEHQRWWAPVAWSALFVRLWHRVPHRHQQQVLVYTIGPNCRIVRSGSWWWFLEKFFWDLNFTFLIHKWFFKGVEASRSFTYFIGLLFLSVIMIAVIEFVTYWLWKIIPFIFFLSNHSIRLLFSSVILRKFFPL